MSNNIPNFVYDKVVDERGILTPNWLGFFNQLIEQLQNTIGQEGIVPPSLSQDNINLLTKAPNGTIVYNLDTNSAQVKNNGIFVNFP
jgi:subtilase family serine protease